MIQKVQKWNNSLIISIPENIKHTLNIKENDDVLIDILEETIVIKPIRKSKKLEELLNKINDENLHSEIETGDPIGNEIW